MLINLPSIHTHGGGQFLAKSIVLRDDVYVLLMRVWRLYRDAYSSFDDFVEDLVRTYIPPTR